MRNRKQNRRGGAMLEFALLCPVWVPLLLGTMWIGSAMVRGLQVTQIARDVASMFCRGVDFSTAVGAGDSNILDKLTMEVGTLTSGGTGVLIFSTLTYVGNSVCAMAPAIYHDNSVPPVHTASCKNYGKFVLTQRYVVGNTNLRVSNFGSAVTGDPDSTNKYKILIDNYVSHTGDATTFNLLPKPNEDGNDGYQSGQPIYVVEAFFTNAGQTGYAQGGNYAYAIF